MMKRTGFKKKNREATGELKLFIRSYAKQGGKCLISGDRLLPPEHPNFHWQGCHLLPKGTYPEMRLVPENVVMVLSKYHDEWAFVKERSNAWLESEDKAYWIPIIEIFRELRRSLYAPE